MSTDNRGNDGKRRERAPQSARSAQLERIRRQEAQLKAERKREIILVSAFIGLLAAGVLLISLMTKDTRKEILKAEESRGSAETESTEEAETVIDTVGKNDAILISLDAQAEQGGVGAMQVTPVLPAETETETLPETAPETVSEAAPEQPSSVNISNTITIPSWITQDFLNVTSMNRPGIALSGVSNIVIHWVGNPGSTAKGNRDYFNDLAVPEANPEGISASAHFIVGLDGEIIQCVPVEEVAYANYPRNDDTISIEVCHPDWEGKYSDVTYASLLRLAAWLCEQYGLSADRLIRHYDVSGKVCPRYYVEHPDAWDQLRQDVSAYMQAHPDILGEFP